MIRVIRMNQIPPKVSSVFDKAAKELMCLYSEQMFPESMETIRHSVILDPVVQKTMGVIDLQQAAYRGNVLLKRFRNQKEFMEMVKCPDFRRTMN